MKLRELFNILDFDGFREDLRLYTKSGKELMYWYNIERGHNLFYRDNIFNTKYHYHFIEEFLDRDVIKISKNWEWDSGIYDYDLVIEIYIDYEEEKKND